MKRSFIIIASVVVLGVFAFWIAQSPSREADALKQSQSTASTDPSASAEPGKVVSGLKSTNKSSGVNSAQNAPDTSHLRRKHNPNQIFIDHTPEERVGFARKGRGPGG